MRSQPSNTAGSGWAFPTLAKGQWKVFRYSAGVCEVVLLTWDPWKKYHRVCFLTVRWPHRFVPWPDVQGVFWAEKLLLKGHTEKTFVYSFWGVIPPHILLLNDADFFFPLMLSFVSDQMSLQLTNKLSELLLLGLRNRVTRPPEQRHPGWKEKPQELFRAVQGLMQI